MVIRHCWCLSATTPTISLKVGEAVSLADLNFSQVVANSYHPLLLYLHTVNDITIPLPQKSPYLPMYCMEISTLWY